VAGSSQCGNEHLGSIKCGEIFDYLRNLLASQEGLCSLKLELTCMPNPNT